MGKLKMFKGLKKGNNIKVNDAEESSPYKTKKSEIQEQIDNVYVDDSTADDLVEDEKNTDSEDKNATENTEENDTEQEDAKEIKESEELDKSKDQLKTDSKHTKKQNKFIQFLNKKTVSIPLIIILSLGLILVMGLTDIKYSVLGVFIKKDIIIETIDSKTLQPVSGVSVTIDDIKSKSDSSGIATLKKVSTGKHLVKLSKSGYTSKNQEIIVRFSTTKTTPIRITGTGYIMSFIVKDKISNLPIKDVKISLAGTDAMTSKTGEATIRALPSGSAKVSLTVSKTDYNSDIEEILVAENVPTKEIKLTPSGNVLYISNKSKTFDVYASDLDGANERVIIPGTGKENDGINIIPSSSGKYAALLSSRDNPESVGYGNNMLYIINISSGEYKLVAEKAYSIFWSNNKLIYYYSEYPESGVYTETYISYDADTGKSDDISVGAGYSYYYLLANGKLFYSLNDAKMPEYGVFSVNTDGSDRKKISTKPVSYIKRHSINLLGFPDYMNNTYKTYNLTTGAIEDAKENRAVTIKSVLSTKDNKCIYLALVDDIFQLYISNSDGSNEKQLTIGANVSDNYYLTLNEKYIIFYAKVGSESGVYIMPINGGDPVMIASAHVAFINAGP